MKRNERDWKCWCKPFKSRGGSKRTEATSQEIPANRCMASFIYISNRHTHSFTPLYIVHIKLRALLSFSFIWGTLVSLVSTHYIFKFWIDFSFFLTLYSILCSFKKKKYSILCLSIERQMRDAWTLKRWNRKLNSNLLIWIELPIHIYLICEFGLEDAIYVVNIKFKFVWIELPIHIWFVNLGWTMQYMVISIKFYLINHPV